jgi:membrane-bound lytic murein transglycosylase B
MRDVPLRPAMPDWAAEPVKPGVRPEKADVDATLTAAELAGIEPARPDPADPESVLAAPEKATASPAEWGKAGSETAGADTAIADPANDAGPARDAELAKDGEQTKDGDSAQDAVPAKDAAPPRNAAPELPAMPSRPMRLLPHRGNHALRRLPPPGKLASTAVHSTAAWSRGPIGRLTLPGLFIAVLIAITGTAGAYLVPATAAQTEPATNAKISAPSGSASASAPAAEVPGTVLPSTGSSLNPSAPAGGSTPGTSAGRPADALRGWAEPLAAKLDIPEVALQAYGYAELVLGQARPACKLSWTTLAAIGKVESDHGRANHATLLPDGRALPAIIGPALDGTNGNVKIPDTDAGALDNDKVWDHAVGPMQFIPSTWRTWAADADGDGIRDPNDIDDASLAAANYLCSDGRDLSTAKDWWAAILSYNNVQPYANAVFTAANNYGVGSHG